MNAERNIPEEIKERLSIEQVVSGYIPLKKAGRIYKGLCPFHGEKTPSFTVSPERGIFKCFGCGKGGDIFDFVMEMEGLTFPEALKLLGDKAGVSVPEHSAPRDPNATSKARVFAVNEYCANAWHKVLTAHPKAEMARAYLEGRGISKKSIEDFKIGYAPLGNGTATALTAQKFSRTEIGAAGDPSKFQDRITFPICDLTGKVVGFTGRLLETKEDPKGESSRGPKYWNTPETSIFIKSKTVYALHIAKHTIQKEGIAILAEGQMDVVALHQAGYTQAVASSGTALTTEQLKLIGRFAPVIAFAYDGDKAGIAATKRGLELAIEAELTPYVIAIPNGKDPADILQTNPEAWKESYENRMPFMEWLIRQELAGASELSSEKKREVALVMISWLAKVNLTEQDTWIPFIAARLKTDESNIRALLKAKYPELRISQPRNDRIAQPTVNHSLADQALAILLTYPEAYPVIKAQWHNSVTKPEGPLTQALLPAIQNLKENQSLGDVLKALDDDKQKELDILIEELLLPYADIESSPSWAVTELSLILQRIRSDARAAIKQHFADEIARAQTLGDTAKVRELFQELQNLV